MTRWLVTGSGGMLGRDLLRALGDRQVTAATRDSLDITDADQALKSVDGHDVVVNCAAWTAVDDAETQEAAAFNANAVGAANLAHACAQTGARLLTLSTDYVFSGNPALPEAPYPTDAPIAPKSAYGRTKAAGEWAVRAILPERHWIVRTAWLYGEHGPSFVRTMARLEASRPTVDVVDDQFGQPTWTRDVAAQLVAMVEAGAPSGTYHSTSSGATTWYDLARAVFEELGADPDRVQRTTSAAFNRPAPRPAWSVLDLECWRAIGLPAIRDWREALTEAMASGSVIDPR